MLEFSISNQLLSRLDATTVVADSENYLECSFQFSQDWENTAAVATFGHSQVQEPISVRIVDGKCKVPHEVIKTYGFQLSVYGTAEEGTGTVCHIPTNVVAVEVEASGTGEGLTPSAPTKSMYDSLMTAILAGETAATEAKVSARASAEAAKGAQEGAEEAKAIAAKGAENSAASAGACAVDALNARYVWELARAFQKVMEMWQRINKGYVLGGGTSEQVCLMKNIPWTEGSYEGSFLNLQSWGDGRYRVRVDDRWYDVVAEWDLIEKAEVTHSDQAELMSGQSRKVEEGEVPEVPEGEEVVVVPDTPGDTGDEGETPETPGGEEVDPGQNTGGSMDSIPVVKPIIHYETTRDVLRLVAGPVTIEDIRTDRAAKEDRICRVKTIDTTVREVEVCVDGERSAKYYFEQAMAAAARAEAAAEARA